MHEAPAIHPGYLLFVDGTTEGFGAVRTVRPHGRPELVVWVENSGEFTVSLHAVTSVHDGKVMVDARKLGQPLRAAIGHAHDHES